MKIIVTIIFAILSHCVCDKFSEELLITPLSSGHVSVLFKFTTIVPSDIRQSDKWTDFDLMSRPLGELISQYNVQVQLLNIFVSC